MFKVFPATLMNGQKIPLIKGWQEAATTEASQIKQWSEQFRERLAFFGVPCGNINHILVLDIDIKTGGWDTIKNNNLVIPDTLSQKTLNGGTHYIFSFDPARDPGNKVGFLPGLDIRSQGGWIAWYNKEVDWSKKILPAPEWLYLYSFADKKTKPVDLPQNTIGISTEIAKGIFDSCIEAITTAAAGESNDVLNRESFKVGQLVASKSISREFAEFELFKAAKLRGKPDYEARATIKSGLDGGIRCPLTAPFHSEPAPAFALPAPPEAPQRWTPPYLTRQDLLNTSKLRKPQLFKDWSTEDITITTADGGTGKTTMKLHEAVCLALGDRFLGFDCLQRGKTLFITGEDTAAKLAAILGAIMNQMGLFDKTPENEAKVETVLKSVIIKKDSDLCLIVKDKQGFLYPNNQALEKLYQAVDDLKPKMIVFDPISSFWGSESALNDMNKAVTRFMSDLVDKSKACVEMINHMGKSSSANKDMTQFAGRGGSGLPSNSRVSRVLRSVPNDEYLELTGSEIMGDNSAMLCNVNKFSDGSPLFNRPFIVVRDRYLFSRTTLSMQKTREIEKQLEDTERIFTFIREQHLKNKYPTQKIIVGYFMNNGSPMSEARIKRAVDALQYFGHMGQKVMQIENPDVTIKDRALIVTDMDGKEEIRN